MHLKKEIHYILTQCDVCSAEYVITAFSYRDVFGCTLAVILEKPISHQNHKNMNLPTNQMIFQSTDEFWHHIMPNDSNLISEVALSPINSNVLSKAFVFSHDTSCQIVSTTYQLIEYLEDEIFSDPDMSLEVFSQSFNQILENYLATLNQPKNSSVIQLGQQLNQLLNVVNQFVKSLNPYYKVTNDVFESLIQTLFQIVLNAANFSPEIQWILDAHSTLPNSSIKTSNGSHLYSPDGEYVTLIEEISKL